MKPEDKDKAKTRVTGVGVFKGAKAAAEQVAELGWKTAQAKVAASHAVEDGVRLAKRTVTRGRYVAEDVADALTLEVRRNPVRALSVAFVAGTLLGCIVGLLASRSRSSS